jgi:hypothetical protein
MGCRKDKRKPPPKKAQRAKAEERVQSVDNTTERRQLARTHSANANRGVGASVSVKVTQVG